MFLTNTFTSLGHGEKTILEAVVVCKSTKSNRDVIFMPEMSL
jgi:hypothetical protein